ncbi:MAG TPA: Ig-like domain-containing protein, partial [Thermoanaerobaculia bacterium]|nr:Ig-like domain-containing protein [Thermoanaerobaculia bacterium]
MSHRALLPLSAVSILLALVALLAPIAGCGKANPVAPSGSTLTLRVSPTTIPSPRGSATATATLIKPNGTPDNGAQVQFSTTLGSFNPTVASTKSDGNAVSTLTGNGTAGIAKVSAFSGDVMTTAELDVTIGGVAKTITLQAIPANISTIGGSPKLVALVRDSLGQPAAGVQVNFTTTVGTLASRGGFKATNASGEATDTLTVLPSDLTNQTSITVTATAAAADGTLQTATAMIAIVNPNAAASVSVSASPGQISATASNAKITLTALV